MIVSCLVQIVHPSLGEGLNSPLRAVRLSYKAFQTAQSSSCLGNSVILTYFKHLSPNNLFWCWYACPRYTPSVAAIQIISCIGMVYLKICLEQKKDKSQHFALKDQPQGRLNIAQVYLRLHNIVLGTVGNLLVGRFSKASGCAGCFLLPSHSCPSN